MGKNISRGKPTFEVDKLGLAKILARRGIEFVVLELIQNALDEKATRVEIGLFPVEGKRGLYTLHVEDDNPEGFKDLAHAYTLFAESQKGANPEKRGRFNLGEKLVIAVCEEAYIKTTKGTIVFKNNKRVHKREHTGFGSIFHGSLRLTKEEAKRIEASVRQVIMPPDIVIYFNAEMNPGWEPEKTFEATLPTEITDGDGYLRRTKRKTTVEVYEVLGESSAQLYELGIPVVPIDCSWHINVRQKIPLNTDRDNVTPAYMREILALVLNEMHGQMDEDAARAAWVDEALESGNITDDAVGTVLTARYGEKRVIADPSDPEGTKLAVSKGYNVIQAGSFNKPQWEAIKRSGTVLPAGQVTPSPKPFSDDPNAKPAEFIPKEKWTEAMLWVADYSKNLAIHLLGIAGHNLVVAMANTPNNFAACYGTKRLVSDSDFPDLISPELTFNVKRLGRKWFEDAMQDVENLDGLLIHEFGHHFSNDHLSEKYHNALCSLGAKLKRLALEGKLTH